jgi:hypothetical protein
MIGSYGGYMSDLMKFIGSGYLMFFAIVMFGACITAKSIRQLIVRVVSVLIFAFIPVAIIAFVASPSKEERAMSEDFKLRYTTAKAMFDEKCKTAGEKIYKTVENVDGVLLKGQRSELGFAFGRDRNWADAALPHELNDEWYIISFVGWEQRQKGGHGPVNIVPTAFPGYKFADVLENDGSARRYRMLVDPMRRDGWGHLAQVPIEGERARYLIEFVNPVDTAARGFWIAETTIKITDTKTGEVLGERRSFAFEPGLGSQAGGRSPWLFARTCPQSIGRETTRIFTESVLKQNLEK